MVRYLSRLIIYSRISTLNLLFFSDHRSVGCIFHEMLVGCPPFTGRSPGEILQDIRSKQLKVPIAGLFTYQQHHLSHNITSNV